MLRIRRSNDSGQWPVVSGQKLKNYLIFLLLITVHSSLVTVVAAYCLLVTGTTWAGEFQVGMKDWEFHPETLEVRVGDTVVWLNDDEDPHNVKFEDASIKGSDERVKPGRRFSVNFDKAGEYPYYCKIHLDQGMKGKIVVK